jgi:hypothetical protein
MNYIQNNSIATELFIKLKYLKPKKVQFKELPVEEKNVFFTTEEQDDIINTFLNDIHDKVELKIHPCANMIKEALVKGFDDYFDTDYFIENCQNKEYGYMFKINDKREYYWNQLFPTKLYAELKITSSANMIKETIVKNLDDKQVKTVKKVKKVKKDKTYFINIHTPSLNRIVGRTGHNNELLVCNTYFVKHSKYNPKTKGYVYEYNKEKATEETTTFNMTVLQNPAVVKFNTFDFDRPLSLYFDDNGKPKGEYI